MLIQKVFLNLPNPTIRNQFASPATIEFLQSLRADWMAASIDEESELK